MQLVNVCFSFGLIKDKILILLFSILNTENTKLNGRIHDTSVRKLSNSIKAAQCEYYDYCIRASQMHCMRVHCIHRAYDFVVMKIN